MTHIKWKPLKSSNIARFSRDALAPDFLILPTFNRKPIASKTCTTVVKLGYLPPPAKDLYTLVRDSPARLATSAISWVFAAIPIACEIRPTSPERKASLRKSTISDRFRRLLACSSSIWLDIPATACRITPTDVFPRVCHFRYALSSQTAIYL